MSSVHEKKNPKVTEIYPTAFTRRSPRIFAQGDSKCAPPRSTSRARADRRRREQHRRARLVGPHGPRRGGRSRRRRVHQRVLQSGMGLIVLHSGHFSKIFKKLMGTTCDLKWREDERSRDAVGHAPGPPDREGHRRSLHHRQTKKCTANTSTSPSRKKTIMISSFAGGEVFRSRLHVAARRRPHRLLPPGPRNVPDLSRQECSQRHRKRRALGRAGK